MPEHFEAPVEQCDLVMKGGITSGIVYPPALFELSKKYTFNSIGGTSAGAVAAAGAAAAEYGRESGGFRRFNEAANELGDRLLELFSAPKETRSITALMQALGMFGSRGEKKPTPMGRFSRAAGSLARHNTPGFVVGAAVGGFLGLLVGWGLNSLGDAVGLWRLAPALVLVIVGSAFGLLIRAIGRLFVRAIVGGVVGVLLSLALIWLLGNWLDEGQVPLATVIIVTFVLVCGLLGGMLGGAMHLLLVVFLKRVPDNFYGIVNGHDPAYERGKDAPRLLTDYLSETIDNIANLGEERRPLTFGQLCRRKTRRNGSLQDAGITLQMVTTNVNHGLPYRLPFTNKLFLFREEEMRRLFPSDVVDHMCERRYKSRRIPEQLLPEGYYFLPEADDFPVVVAMRMSLAIPIFFSAIPLYTIKAASYAKVRRGIRLDAHKDLQINFFSDGGSTSNFPIHSFDRWLPTRPTFGINLTAMPSEALPDENDLDTSFQSVVFDLLGEEGTEGGGTDGTAMAPAAAASVPAVELRKPNAPVTPEWRPVNNPLTFLQKVVDAARENHDNLQSVLPGYRERIIEIRFDEGEGGMNLAMDKAAINSIKLKGELAGERLSNDFSFDQHRWTRFLVLMSQLETQLEKMKGAFEGREYAQLLTSDMEGANFPYLTGHDCNWREGAAARAADLVGVVDKWKARVEVEKALRVRPRSRAQVEASTDGVHGAALSPRKVVRRIPHCDANAREAQLDYFNFKPPRLDRIPKPKSVLRVTPDM